ncbi:tetratricopeptide repeat protein [Nonomuraea sp. NBC_00507]|uniref:AfsR/SARP family transcriptional regulator n=1 Tax=Nonomuraea sp. NBC_00507 TaxID=2976002 RepID=UPI002E177FC1
MAGMAFSVLGQMEVTAHGDPIDIGSRKQRMLLGLLLRSANRPVPSSQLIDALWWDGETPSSSGANLRVYVHNLRRAFEAGKPDERLTSGRHGYLLTVRPGELDSGRFEELVTQGRKAAEEGDPERASSLLGQGLGLWRDAAYAGLTDCPPLAEEAARLEELRLSALHDRLVVDLTLGRHADVITTARGLVAEHPMRERFTEQLMLALYRSGRQAEALEAYQQTRQALVDELGIEPGPELRRVHQAVLRGAPIPVRTEQPAGPAELPADVETFTGRSAEIVRLRAALTAADRRSAAVCAIAGPGGIGKSALAVHVAHQVAGQYDDGQLYIDLNGSTPGVKALEPIEALSRMLRSLGVEGSAVPIGTDEAAARLRTLTQHKRMLFVLDNAADAAQVRPLLPARPGCGVLVTSRKLLTTLDAAVHERLEVLPDGDSHALLRRLLGPDRVDAEPEAAAEVVRRCGRLPLAIRIAAARLTSRPGWEIRTLADRLATEQNRLSELEVDDRAVRTSFMPSYRALDYPTARMFRLTGALDTTDIGVPAAAALAGLPDQQAETLLDQLTDAQLMETRAPGRYGMHDLLRLFARERVNEEETEPEVRQAVERVLHWYLSTARTATQVIAQRQSLSLGPEPMLPGLAIESVDDACAWIDTEARNLPAIVARASCTGPELTVALAAALYAPLDVRGRFREQVVIGQLAVEACDATGDLRYRAAAHANLGGAHNRVGNLEESIYHAEIALAASRKVGDQRGESSQLNLLALSHRLAGRFEEAISLFRQALKLVRRQGNRLIEGIMLTNLGTTYQKADRLGEAFEVHTESLAIAEEVGNATGIAVALGHLADIDRLAGSPADAVKRYRAALDADSAAGTLETPLEAEHWWGLGQAYWDLGEREQARDAQGKCVAILDRLDLISGNERRTIETSDNPEPPESIRRTM